MAKACADTWVQESRCRASRRAAVLQRLHLATRSTARLPPELLSGRVHEWLYAFGQRAFSQSRIWLASSFLASSYYAIKSRALAQLDLHGARHHRERKHFFGAWRIGRGCKVEVSTKHCGHHLDLQHREVTSRTEARTCSERQKCLRVVAVAAAPRCL